MCTSFNSNSYTAISFCYSPTNASDKTDIIIFFNELYSLVQRIPKHKFLIISGDMNAQIGKDRKNKFCLRNSSDRNGVYLNDFSHENRLGRFNTKFQKRKENHRPTSIQITVKHS